MLLNARVTWPISSGWRTVIDLSWPCATPRAWVDAALDNTETLLVDHANCEKKAASTALNLMYRYVEYPDLLNKLSRPQRRTS